MFCDIIATISHAESWDIMEINKTAVTKLVKYMFIVDEDNMLVALNRLIGIKDYYPFIQFVIGYFAFEKLYGTSIFKLPEEAPMLDGEQWEEYRIEMGMQIIEELASRGRIDERDEVILGKRLKGEPIIKIVK